jgi:predicted ATPase
MFRVPSVLPGKESSVEKSVANGVPLLRAITLRNLLSFGPKGLSLPLENLNVLVGPNGSGKSNLLEAISVLQSAPNDFRQTIQKGGGVAEWIWKGAPSDPATIEAVIANPYAKSSLRHVLAFRHENQFCRLDDERIEDEQIDEADEGVYYQFRQGRPAIKFKVRGGSKWRSEKVDRDLSILAQRRDPTSYPEITHLAESYGRIRLYRDWRFGRGNVLRAPRETDDRSDLLLQNASNLGLFLNRLKRKAKTKEALLTRLRDLYDGLDDFDVNVEGGTVQVFFTEGEFSIPAARLSDGSLRYIFLLAVLGDPDPPPLIGIEEPELGLHPDLIPKIADLLIDASRRTQLIVTTHSDILIDALTERPSAVVVCEKHDGQTTMRRLSSKRLSKWLDKYRLGQLWSRGELGGNRW